MQPAAVDEHGAEQGHGRGQTGMYAQHVCMVQRMGNKAIGFDQKGRALGQEEKLVDKYQNIDHDQQNVDNRYAAGWIVIF